MHVPSNSVGVFFFWLCLAPFGSSLIEYKNNKERDRKIKEAALGVAQSGRLLSPLSVGSPGLQAALAQGWAALAAVQRKRDLSTAVALAPARNGWKKQSAFGSVCRENP